MAPNTTFFVIDIPLQLGQRKYSLAKWVNAQLACKLIGQIDVSGITFEQGSIVPVRWSVALEEAKKGLKDKTDAEWSEVQLWETLGIYVGLTGVQLLPMEAFSIGSLVQAVPGTDKFWIWEENLRECMILIQPMLEVIKAAPIFGQLLFENL